jgi:hypothetical protein
LRAGRCSTSRRVRCVVRRADGGRHRAHAAGLDEPADIELGRTLNGLAERPPDLGHRQIPGGQPGVGDDDAGEAIPMFCGKPKADQATPVLADERHLAQVKHIERQGAHPLHVSGVGVILDPGGLVGAAEPDQVRTNNPMPG